MKPSLKTCVLSSSILFAGGVLSLPAVDFIRGDANDDGRVTIADSHRITRLLFLGKGQEFNCGDAADFDNDGKVTLADAVGITTYLFLEREPPNPFPQAGPDDGPDEPVDRNWPCNSYGLGTPLEDPAATLRVLDAIAPGGHDRKATLVLGISNSNRVAGYYAELDPAGIISPRRPTEPVNPKALGNDGVWAGLSDLTGTLAGGFIGAMSDTRSGNLKMGFLSSAFGDIGIPPRGNQLVLEAHVCLEPGTRAGVYPLTLKAGELVDYESARRIDPALVSGTLTILEDVAEETCVIEPFSPPSRSDLLDITFELGEASGVPGGEVTVPFSVKTSDQAFTEGLDFSIEFDEEALQLVAVETVLQRPDGLPWPGQAKEIFNADTNPGNDPDEGYVLGSYSFSWWDQPGRQTFPMNQEFVALNLRFLIQGGTSPQVSEVRFLDGIEKKCVRPLTSTFLCGWKNQILSSQAELSPELVNSFVFINGRINIVPDVTVFVRGDSNGDGKVNISDAEATLSFLFLGARGLHCFDAADANDDGRLDISDAIETLQFLFLGGASLPPPNGAPGEDPTPDAMTCALER